MRARPAYIGLVASHKRGQTVLGYLAEHGVDDELLEQVHVPVGLDLGHTSHTEIAVSILAELVQLRASGELVPSGQVEGAATGTGHGDRSGVRDDGDGRRRQPAARVLRHDLLLLLRRLSRRLREGSHRLLSEEARC